MAHTENGIESLGLEGTYLRPPAVTSLPRTCPAGPRIEETLFEADLIHLQNAIVQWNTGKLWSVLPNSVP